MAAAIGLAESNGDTFGFPRWKYESVFPIQGCFCDNLPSGPEYRELRYSYDPIPYQPSLRLSGFFQSEIYFKDHKGLVRELFTPFGVPKRDQYAKIASLHIRRGDYLLLPDKHPILPMSYYDEAVEYLRSNYDVKKFLVFSDDLPWCRDRFMRDPFEVIPDTPPVKQLALTIACEHHIMANSTFSWWGAWLDPNPDKIVIAPKIWFGPGYAHYDTKDLLPPEWIVM